MSRFLVGTFAIFVCLFLSIARYLNKASYNHSTKILLHAYIFKIKNFIYYISDISRWKKGKREFMDLIRQILQNSKTIAVIGMKDEEDADAFKVPQYMSKMGYKIYPVNPARRGKNFQGEEFVSKVTDLKVTIDIVNIFRRPKFLLDHTAEILQMDSLPKYVWFQLGIRNDDAAEVLEEAGVKVVQNRCVMVEHTRLFA